MTKVYLVKHCYDTDGGFGDAVSQEEVLCGFVEKLKLQEVFIHGEEPEDKD